ncbi:MAG: hypothetical protein OSA45_06900 [Halioglobus sp.]|nr:hypothetical protein [Halioglobus sp.]
MALENLSIWGALLLNPKGSFYHVVSPGEDGFFWSFIGHQVILVQDLVKASIETGEIVRRIDMADTRKENPDLHVWDLFRYKFESREELRATGNMTHGNDIEPLPEALAADFPDHNADVQISHAFTEIDVIVPAALER